MVFKLKKYKKLIKVLSFIVLSALFLLLLVENLSDLIGLVSNEHYTHMTVIPVVSFYLLWLKKNSILSENSNLVGGTILLTIGIIWEIILNCIHWKDIVTELFFKTSGILVLIYGLFILLWGFRAFKKSHFPLVLLLLALPFPTSVFDVIIGCLRWGSAIFVESIFKVIGQPYLRDGATFRLNTVIFSIAPECSGIRSTMALVITGALFVEILLRSFWNKLVMFLVIIPLSLLKNAIRIVTITLLAQYIDIAFLTHSFLHKSGGIIFYIIVLVMYLPLLIILSKLEQNGITKTISEMNSVSKSKLN
jgi:exosortase